MDIIFLTVICILNVILIAMGIVTVIAVKKKDSSQDNDKLVNQILAETQKQQSILRQELNASTQQSVKSMGEMISENQKSFSQNQQEKFLVLGRIQIPDTSNKLQYGRSLEMLKIHRFIRGYR